MANWFYKHEDREVGPVDASVLRQLAGVGALLPTDEVRRDDMPTWVSANRVKGLFASADAPVVPAPTTPPPPPVVGRPSEPTPKTTPQEHVPVAEQIGFGSLFVSTIKRAAALAAESLKPISCPHCKALIPRDPAHGGDIIACPQCGKQVRLPATKVSNVPSSVASAAPYSEVDTPGSMRSEANTSDNPLGFLNAASGSRDRKEGALSGGAATTTKKSLLAKYRSMSEGAKAGIGCLIAFVLMLGGVAIFYHDESKGSGDAVITGTNASWTATVKYLYMEDDDKVEKLTAPNLAEDVYGFAVAHPAVKSVEITLMVDPAGMLTDKYGHPVKQKIRLGVIEIGDLDDVRKYANADAYQYDNVVIAIYAGQINRLRRFGLPILP